MHQDFVGIDVELLLGFALYVDFTDITKNVRQAGAANAILNHLGRQRNRRKQPGKFARSTGEAFLLLKNMLLNGHDGDGRRPFTSIGSGVVG